ncbi:MAG: hypothetical protein M3Y27_20285 [Acidobacteriota bacterium]|nr:hypothetical protein [Acidobacteriota bacterium]
MSLLLDRRDFMKAAGAAPFAAIAATGGADNFDGAHLYRDVETYANLGEHRTATVVDIRTSQWLASELKQAGFAVERRPFRLRQFSLKAARFEVDGRVVESFPVWWPKPTGVKPVTGKLRMMGTLRDGSSPTDLTGKIAVFSMPEVRGASLVPNSPVNPILTALAKAGAVAAIGISQVETGELMALNAMAGPEPWPVPFLLAGRKEESALAKSAAADATGSVLIDGSDDPQAEAYEVIGRLDRGGRLFIVSTPYSGWFHCAGERGPGIALWLALARWAPSRKDSFIFVASSAHELDGVGIHSFVNEVAPKPGQVACWLHLGAGIATYDYRRIGNGIEMLKTASPMRRLYTVPQFEPVLRESFSDLPDLKPIVTDKPGGEMIMMAQKGYPVMGFAGGSPFHHMPGDLPQRVTGPELLEPVARDLLKALLRI